MRAYLYICLTLLLLACSSTKNLNKGPIPVRSDQDIFDALSKRNIDFEWFHGKMSTHVSSTDENVSGSMIVRMKKDSAIWVVVKKLGIEFARVWIDPSEFTVLYRLEGAYEVSPINKINDLFAVAADFQDIQQLMFGNVILPEQSAVTITKDSIYYKVLATVDGLNLLYYINAFTLDLDKMVVVDKMNRSASAQYSDYKQLDTFGRVAYNRVLTFPDEYGGTSRVSFDFSELEINVPKEMKFSIPKSYEKIN